MELAFGFGVSADICVVIRLLLSFVTSIRKENPRNMLGPVPTKPQPVVHTREQEAQLAKERDVKFKKWLQNKAIKDKAFEVRH